MRMDQEPDYGDEPLDPPTREEEEAEAWEYWHQRALKLEQELAETKGQLSIVRTQRDTVTMALNSYLRGHGLKELTPDDFDMSRLRERAQALRALPSTTCGAK